MIQSGSVTRIFRKSTPALVAAVLAVGLLASASRGLAVTMTWTNGNDVWTSPTAWTTNTSSGVDPVGATNILCAPSLPTGATSVTNCVGGTGGFPGAGDAARFTNNTSYTVSISSPTSVNTITFSNTAGIVTMNAGASTLTVTGRVRIADHSATSTVVWAGGTLSVANGNAATMQIGDQTNSSGALIVSGGTAIMEGNVSIGQLPATVGKLIVSGGVVTNGPGMVANLGFVFRSRTPGSQIVVTNGGKLFWQGESRAESNSLILVSDPGSYFYCSNVPASTSCIAIGDLAGPGCKLTVSNGATMFADGTISIGRNAGSSNTGIVVGAGSKLITSAIGNITIGVGSAQQGHDNFLSVSDGGYVECGGPFFSVPGGTTTNCTFLMGGVGAMSTGLAVAVRGNSQGLNSLIVVTNAVFTCTKMSVTGSGTNNLLVLSKGTLNVNKPDATETNAVSVSAVGGTLIINAGTLNAVSGTNGILITVGGSGTLTGNSLIITNGGNLFADAIRIRSTNSIVFTSGTLSVGGMDITSGANGSNEFVVGDGIGAAYYDMTPNGDGYHSFGSPGLIVTNNAFLRGSGTLTGTLVVNGTLVPGFANSVGSIFTSNSLSFGDSAVVDFDLGTLSDSVTVNGNLALGNSLLNVTAAGGFAAGPYVLFTHTNTVTAPSGTLTVGALPVGFAATVSNDVPNAQVLLVVTSTGGGNPYTAWLTHYGLTGGNALGTADPDGDGMNNTNEFLAGFSPTSSTAYLHVISIARTNGTDIKVTYLGANGDSTYSGGPASRTNVLEFTTGTANGSYATSNFASTGQTNVLSGGTGVGVITNMVDLGGASSTARYYRVRVLVP